jgi:predicted phage terminase large subunit-like protein
LGTLSPRNRPGIQAEIARKRAELAHGDADLGAIESLASFVQQGWPIIEPGRPLDWNWHLDLICDALERQIRGEQDYRKLLICIPPGTMKSILVSVMAPAWEWLHKPTRRKIFLSNDDKLAARDSRRMREVVKSEWYLRLVELQARRGVEAWVISRDQDEKVNFENTQRGFRQSLSFGSKITGKRGDDIGIDDPMDAKEVTNGSVEQVGARLAAINNIIEMVLPTRVNSLADARWTMIMQRLHLDDPAARAMAEGGWHVINLQMEFRPGHERNHPKDPRTQPGELLHPERFPAVEINKLRAKLHLHYDAQYQQDPRPGDAAVLKRWYWRFWYPREVNHPPQPVLVMKPDGTMHECVQAPLPELLGTYRQSWDCAFKDTKDSAYVVGQVWAERGANSYLLDQVRDKMDIVATLEAVGLLTKRWPQALEKLIEDKANGPGVIRILHDKIPGLVPVEPKGGKETRMNASAPVCRSGNIWLPHPSLWPWVNAFLDEAEAAPFGAYMDQVDAFTQYCLHRYGDGASFLDSLTQM